MQRTFGEDSPGTGRTGRPEGGMSLLACELPRRQGMLIYYYRQAASLREEQAGSEGVTSSRCAGLLPQGRAWAVLGLVAGGCPEP